MSASQRAALKIMQEGQLIPGHSEFHWNEAGISGERVAEIVDAEYEPLIKKCYAIADSGYLSLTLTRELNELLDHIEGDATP